MTTKTNYMRVGQTVSCPYFDKCCDVLTEKCNSCQLNKDKRSYYQPQRYYEYCEPYYYPHLPETPWVEWNTCYTQCDTEGVNTSVLYEFKTL